LPRNVSILNIEDGLSSGVLDGKTLKDEARESPGRKKIKDH
jgi:hypothetical protein